MASQRTVTIGAHICDFEVIRQVLIANGFSGITDCGPVLTAKYDFGDIPDKLIGRSEFSPQGLDAQIRTALKRHHNKSDEYPNIVFA